jgi:hypothetical protein
MVNFKTKIKMKKNVNKLLVAAGFFSVAFLGISVSRLHVNVAGETASVTMVSLGTQVKAYCNEATPSEGFNDGKCSGAHNSADSRCLVPNNDVPKNCKRDQW